MGRHVSHIGNLGSGCGRLISSTGGENTIGIQSLLVKAEQENIPARKTHATLLPRTNLRLLFVWALAVIFAFLIVQPHLPYALGLVGGLLGALAGVMQHLSIMQDPPRFMTASSLMGVRRALTSTAWGRRYIVWLYFCKIVLLLIAFLLIRAPLYRVALGYLAAHFSLMLVRDAVTMRDIYALHRLGGATPVPPEISG